MVEHWREVPGVRGSTPLLGTWKLGFYIMVLQKLRVVSTVIAVLSALSAIQNRCSIH